MDIRATIDERPMHRLQIGVIALCVALNAIDGFDVVSISFAAPGIAADWGIDRAMLGVVLSLELLGMAAGSVLVGAVSDFIGRRWTILACMAVVTVSMYYAASTDGVASLSIARLITGVGIGGVYATSSAMVAEWSNAKRRSLNVILNIVGVSMGGIVGGTIAAMLLRETGDWRTVFLLGAGMTALFMPLVFFFMPESLQWLIARRPRNALERVQKILRRLDIPPIDALPEAEQGVREAPKSPLSPALLRLTLLLTLTYFSVVMCYYYLIKWTPKLVVDMGFDAASAGGVLVSANYGMLLGGLIMGLLSLRYRLRPLLIGAMLLGCPAIVAFAIDQDSLVELSAYAAVAGFFIAASVVGLFPIIAHSFPAAIRGGGTGFVIGVGRGGAAIGPMAAGALLAAGASLVTVAAVISVGMLIGAATLLFLPWAQSKSAAAAA